MFLRGLGGSSGVLDEFQEDMGRRIYGRFGSDALFAGMNNNGFVPEGVFGMDAVMGWKHLSWTVDAEWVDSKDNSGGQLIILDSDSAWGEAHSGNEFRPANKAVLYIIKAR